MIFMKAAQLREIMPGVFRWEEYSNEHKVNLTSHGLIIERQLFIFDPIPLAENQLQRLIQLGKPAAIILTNDNHERDAARWRARLHVPIWASCDAMLRLGAVKRLGSDVHQWGPFQAARIVGGSRGELCFRWPAGSVAVLGDAVTNLPDYGLMLLTEKYCQHLPTLRHSLRQMLYSNFENLLLAHGGPILGKASKKVLALLTPGSASQGLSKRAG